MVQRFHTAPFDKAALLKNDIFHFYVRRCLSAFATKPRCPNANVFEFFSRLCSDKKNQIDIYRQSLTGAAIFFAVIFFK